MDVNAMELEVLEEGCGETEVANGCCSVTVSTKIK